MAETKFPIEASHIMMFARALGDSNPIYRDAEHAQTTEPGGIVAPPTFPRACAQFDPDYPLRPRAAEPWFGSAKEPTGLPAGTQPSSSGGLRSANSAQTPMPSATMGAASTPNCVFAFTFAF